MILTLKDQYYTQADLKRTYGLNSKDIKTFVEHKILQKIRVNKSRKGIRYKVKEFFLEITAEEFNKIDNEKLKKFINDIQDKLNRNYED